MENNKTNLNDILKNDDIALDNVISDLKKRGWCFIKFSELFNTTIQNFSCDMKKFFESDKETKKKYSYSHTIGYYELPFKQHFKILTGNYNLPNTKGTTLETSVEKLSRLMDKLMLKLTLSPIFNITKKDAEYLSIFGNDKAGLLDIVKYTPNIDIKERPFYVNQHVDPGLFSFNIFSDASGMQFYDQETKSWYEMPMGYGAIFCGQAAKTLLNFSPAIHRVVNNGIGRMSIWYEVGIKSQLQPKNTIKKLEFIEDKNSSVPNTNDILEKKLKSSTEKIIIRPQTAKNYYNYPKQISTYKSSSNYMMNNVYSGKLNNENIENQDKSKPNHTIQKQNLPPTKIMPTIKSLQSSVIINVEIEGLNHFEKSKTITLYLPKNGTIMDIKKGIENDSSGGMPISKVMPSLEVQKQQEKEREKIKKRANLIKNLDNKKFGDVHYWKLTMDGYLQPSKPPKPHFIS
jgi:isopenicillin N synthase-like dioxygenase